MNKHMEGVGLINSRQHRKSLRKAKTAELAYVRLLVSMFCLVAVIQGLLRFDSMRRLLNESIWLEGEPLARAVSGLKEPLYTWVDWMPEGGIADSDNSGMICLKFIGKPNKHVWIMVNGKAIKRADTEDGVIVCSGGDLIEVIAEKGQANVVVSAVSSNVQYPKVGTWAKGDGILLLGRVKLAIE